MKKSLISVLLIAALLGFPFVASSAGNDVDETTQSVEKIILDEDTNTQTSTETVTSTDTQSSTETSTSTSVDTDKKEEKDTTSTSTATATSTNEEKDTNDKDTPKSSDEGKSPYGNNKVTKEAAAEEITIKDTETAASCGIKDIEEGYPKDGKVAGTGGDNLRLRSWPWGNVLGMYPEGTAVKIIGKSGEFYLVEVNGQQGYMHKNYISTSDGEASGKAPYYPGSTRSGGALSLEDGVKASEDGAAGKVPTTTGGTPGAVTISGDKVVLDVPKKNQYQAATPAPGSSCGPTSLAMCLAFFGKGDPSVLVTDLYNVCGCTAANGTGHAGLEKGAHKYGLTEAKFYYSVSQDWCRQQLKAGKPVLCHVAHHYVVMKGMDSNGNVILNDPAYNGVERTMSWSEFSVWWNNSGLGHSAMTF